MKALLLLAMGLALAACGQNKPPAPPSRDGAAQRVSAPAPSAAATTASAAAGARPAPQSAPAPAAAPVAEQAPAEPVLDQMLAYGETQDSNLMGYLAMPRDAAQPLPALIVIHEWWGLNDNVKAMTRRLAGEGYVALAVDLYGGKVAKTPAQAKKLMSTAMSDPGAARDNIRQAYEYLTHYALAPKVGTIGWCFGGGWSLRTALMPPGKLDAAVVYYGELVTDPKQLGGLDTPLLGLFGDKDETIPVQLVQTFRSRLSALGKDAQIYIYPGAAHAFANPSSGANYDAKAASDAWTKTVAFLHTHLQ